jgi:tetratricopeptide repeat protein 30
LVEHYPDIDPYKLYFAQALYKAGDYEAALTACLNVNQPDYVDSSFKLQAAIKFQMDDLNGAKSILDQSLRKDDITTIANRGCLLFKVMQCMPFHQKLNEINSVDFIERKIR